MQLGFTGTRHGLTEPQAAALCKALWHYRQWCEVMHNSDCVGADEYAGKYWLLCAGQIWLHPPVVKKNRAYLPAAITATAKPYAQCGMEIVLASDVLIACPSAVSSGTMMTVRYAREAEKTVFIIAPDGATTKG